MGRIREWDVKQAEFQGYMKAKVGGIDKKLGNLCPRVEKLESEHSRLKGIYLGVGAVLAALAGIAGASIKEFIKGFIWR